jgi:hypothetical protein
MVNKATRTMPIQPHEVGLPPPPADPTSKRFVANQHILQALRNREVIVKPNIAHFAGGTVVFTDGSSETVDIVIYATGYHQSFPFFDDQLLGAPGDDVALYRNVMHPRYHNLFIVGMYRPLCAFWPLAEQQARWIAPLLTGEYALPRQSELDRQTFPILKIPAFNCAFYGHDLRLDTQRGKKRAQQSGFQPPIQALAWRYPERGAEAGLTHSRQKSVQG